MAVHIDFAFACFLKPDTPEHVLDVLRYITQSEGYDPSNPPASPFTQQNHPDLAGPLWHMFEEYSGSTDFPGETGAVLRSVYRHNRPAVEGGGLVFSHSLCFRYFERDDGFWGPYLDLIMWVAPYSESEGCVGYYRASWDNLPTLIYFSSGRAYLYKVPWLPDKLELLG